MPRLLAKLATPFMPPIQTARHYTLHKLRADLVAGLTVSVVELPQAMAYAIIAGVPPQYGIYTSIIQGVIGALLSSSEHLTTGPTNTQSLLVASAVARLAQMGGPQYLQLVFALAMLKGLIQLGFAAARMGTMVHYVSRSVIVGVAAGAGVLIIAGQLPAFVGIEVAQSHRHLPGVLGAVERVWPHLGEMKPLAMGIGALSLAIVLGGRLISPFVPGALLAVIVSAAVVAAMGWTAGELPLVPSLPRAFPHFSIPQISWGQAESLLGGALALALLGMLESVAIAKSIAARSGERIDPNQEFFTQGLKNFLSSFFQCIPGSGSFTRSALDYAAGAQTRFAAVFNGLFVALLFWGLAGWARFIPMASLSAVLLVIAVGLIDWRYFWRIVRADRQEALVCGVTFLATALAPLEYAIFIGVFLSIGMYLRKASRLRLMEMHQLPGGRFIERPIRDRTGQRKVIFLQVEGDLFFAVADELEDHLAGLARSEVRVVILRLKRLHSIDVTVLEVLERFTQQMQERGGQVILCGIRTDVMDVLRRFGLVDLIGRDNVFYTGFGVFDSAKRALRRARELVGSSIDIDAIPTDDEAEEFFYQI